VFAEATTSPCAGHPTGEQIVALLRRTPRLVPADGPVTFQIGPLCAGTWQYSVVIAAGQEPLRALTQGRPAELRLVAAGSDICTAVVRASAPPGFRTLLNC
jgi:hypothetical protein